MTKIKESATAQKPAARGVIALGRATVATKGGQTADLDGIVGQKQD
jgi:hypothetical protein